MDCARKRVDEPTLFYTNPYDRQRCKSIWKTAHKSMKGEISIGVWTMSNPNPRTGVRQEAGTTKSYWNKNCPDARVLLTDLHRGVLNTDISGAEICQRYSDFHQKWGTRRLKENWSKLVEEYELWMAGKDCKDFSHFVQNKNLIASLTFILSSRRLHGSHPCWVWSYQPRRWPSCCFCERRATLHPRSHWCHWFWFPWTSTVPADSTRSHQHRWGSWSANWWSCHWNCWRFF